MLELVLVIGLYRQLSDLAALKSRSKWWGAVGPLGWFGGELTGGVLVALLGDGDTLATYGFALLGGVFGALIAYFVVRSLPALGGAHLSRGESLQRTFE